MPKIHPDNFSGGLLLEECKTQLYGSKLVLADRSLGRRALGEETSPSSDRFFPSSKLCPCCGHKKEQLPLSIRVYDCENCDWIADRYYSASLNLLRLVRPDVAVRPRSGSPS